PRLLATLCAARGPVGGPSASPSSCLRLPSSFSSFFTDPSPTEIYSLSLHDALPILLVLLPAGAEAEQQPAAGDDVDLRRHLRHQDRKSTRLNSSHGSISYAVFCLKKKKERPVAARATLQLLARHLCVTYPRDGASAL